MNHKFWNAGVGKSEGNVHVVKNAEASVTIKAGQPCIYAANGTDDGLAVVLPSSSTAVKCGFLCAGVAVKDIPVGTLQNVQVYGFNRMTRVIRGSRAATTDSWPTMAAIAIGDVFTIDTVGNGFRSAGVGSNLIYQPAVAAMEVVASAATAASSGYSGDYSSGLYHYTNVKTFLRFM